MIVKNLKFLFLALLALVGQAELLAQPNAEESLGVVPTRVEQIQIFPEAFEGLLRCQFDVVQEFSIGDMVVAVLTDAKKVDCVDELEVARSNLYDELKINDPDMPPGFSEAIFKSYTSKIGQLTLPVTVGFSNAEWLMPKSFTVPDGMWEYHLCRTLQTSTPVYIAGELAVPRFPDDKDCALSRAYSRKAAFKSLKQAGEQLTSNERNELIDQYIRDIDEQSEQLKNNHDRP